ncbi:MAG TPA: hypothetical protein VJM31_05755 [Vicinamibacterales bacterium]|nr:hypothetical protein [Vicinamibacterales bacterium]
MSDPLRIDPIKDHGSPSLDGDAERNAKIERLLLSGLDHYFAANYTQAIDVWTRALFLDRQHARARAYIERARSALAEDQRESEELLHNGVAAFERGEIEAARQMLTAAVQRGGAHEVALAFLTRIDRLSAAGSLAPAPAAVRRSLPFSVNVAPVAHLGSRWTVVCLLLAVLAASAFGFASWDQMRAMIPLLGTATTTDLAPVRTIQEPVIVPTSSETAIDRAQSLFASGRLYDALRAVDLVRPTDPLRADADKLKAAIQRELLAHQTK